MNEPMAGLQQSCREDCREFGIQFDQQAGLALSYQDHMVVPGVHGDAFQSLVVRRVWEVMHDRVVVGHG